MWRHKCIIAHHVISFWCKNVESVLSKRVLRMTWEIFLKQMCSSAHLSQIFLGSEMDSHRNYNIGGADVDTLLSFLVETGEHQKNIHFLAQKWIFYGYDVIIWFSRWSGHIYASMLYISSVSSWKDITNALDVRRWWSKGFIEGCLRNAAACLFQV